MCELDWGFTTRRVRRWGIYGRTSSLKDASSKVVKHKKYVPTINMFLYHLFGFLTSKIVNLLHRVQASCTPISCLLGP